MYKNISMTALVVFYIGVAILHIGIIWLGRVY